MTLLTAAIALLSLAVSSVAQANDIRAVAPALETYTHDRLFGEVWKRPGLSPCDRSVVTLAVLIARHQTVEMSYSINLALDHGVKPAEISEIMTHLAFYSRWANAMSAVAATQEVFAKRRIGSDQPPPVSPKLLPLNEAAEKERAVPADTCVRAVAFATSPPEHGDMHEILFRPARQALEGMQQRLDLREGEVHEASRDLPHGRERGRPYPHTPVAA